MDNIKKQNKWETCWSNKKKWVASHFSKLFEYLNQKSWIEFRINYTFSIILLFIVSEQRFRSASTQSEMMGNFNSRTPLCWPPWGPQGMSDSQEPPRYNSKLNSDMTEHQHRPFGKMVNICLPFTAKKNPLEPVSWWLVKNFRAVNLVLGGAPMKE